ncbi:MAG: LacI family DNA-binding transcriptional regulator [Clostridiales bacterium]|nr:LacI family DNA-binding transcriptional regulator [Clostridiales bacterium]
MSLKKIAELTGASVSTISRVLNQPDYHCRDEKLADLIRKTARDIQYVPNDSARQLKNGNSPRSDGYRIDVLLARFQSLQEDDFFLELFRFLETEILHQKCQMMEVLNVPDLVKRDRNKQKPEADGLIILGKCTYDLVERLKGRYRAIAAIDRNPTEYQLDEVVCSGVRAAAQAMNYLADLGHRKIGYVGDCSMEARYTGYYECLLQRQIPFVYNYVVSTHQTRQEGFHAYEILSEEGRRPTAVLCANDVTALGFIDAMNRYTKGRKKSIYRPAVISIDDIEEASRCSPMLSSVHIPRNDMVHMAVMLLLDRLRGDHKEFVRLEIPSHLIIRESTGDNMI